MPEVNEHDDLSFKLTRPNDMGHRVLACECGNDAYFEIALADNGQWQVECLDCGRSAVLLADLTGKLK